MTALEQLEFLYSKINWDEHDEKTNNIKRTLRNVVDMNAKAASNWRQLEEELLGMCGYEDAEGEWVEYSEEEGGDLSAIGEAAAYAFNIL